MTTDTFNDQGVITVVVCMPTARRLGLSNMVDGE